MRVLLKSAPKKNLACGLFRVHDCRKGLHILMCYIGFSLRRFTFKHITLQGTNKNATEDAKDSKATRKQNNGPIIQILPKISLYSDQSNVVSTKSKKEKSL